MLHILANHSHTAAAKTAKLTLGPGRLRSIQGLPSSMLHGMVTMPQGVDFSFLETDSAHAVDLVPADAAAGLASGLWEGGQRSLAGMLSMTALYDRSIFRPKFFLALPSVPYSLFLRQRMSEASKTVGLECDLRR